MPPRQLTTEIKNRLQLTTEETSVINYQKKKTIGT